MRGETYVHRSGNHALLLVNHPVPIMCIQHGANGDTGVSMHMPCFTGLHCIFRQRKRYVETQQNYCANFNLPPYQLTRAQGHKRLPTSVKYESCADALLFDTRT